MITAKEAENLTKEAREGVVDSLMELIDEEVLKSCEGGLSSLVLSPGDGQIDEDVAIDLGCVLRKLGYCMTYYNNTITIEW